MVIHFNSERARNQLLEYGVVISARKQRKQTGNTNAQYHSSNGISITIGKVDVQIIDESSCVDTLTHRPVLEKYLEFSGFNTVKDWEDEICIMNRGNRMPLYLVIVKVILLEKYI